MPIIIKEVKIVNNPSFIFSDENEKKFYRKILKDVKLKEDEIQNLKIYPVKICGQKFCTDINSNYIFLLTDVRQKTKYELKPVGKFIFHNRKNIQLKNKLGETLMSQDINETSTSTTIDSKYIEKDVEWYVQYVSK